VTTYGVALAANRQRLTTPPPPADAIEAARHAEIRAWFAGLGQTQQNAAIQNAVNTLDPELLAALFHAPVAFGIIAPKTRDVVGEVYARATNLDGYENLLIGEEQLRAAQEGISRARWIVSQVVGWQPADYERADREATRPCDSGGPARGVHRRRQGLGQRDISVC
jgi:DnaJ-domain-containing protein 1